MSHFSITLISEYLLSHYTHYHNFILITLITNKNNIDILLKPFI